MSQYSELIGVIVAPQATQFPYQVFFRDSWCVLVSGDFSRSTVIRSDPSESDLKNLLPPQVVPPQVFAAVDRALAEEARKAAPPPAPSGMAGGASWNGMPPLEFPAPQTGDTTKRPAHFFTVGAVEGVDIRDSPSPFHLPGPQKPRTMTA